MASIRLRLLLSDARQADSGSGVRVILQDTTMEDELHPSIAEATGVLASGHDSMEIALEVPESGLDPRHRYSIWAHVDHETNGKIKAGDLITTQNVPVAQKDLDAGVVDVPLTRI